MGLALLCAGAAALLLTRPTRPIQASPRFEREGEGYAFQAEAFRARVDGAGGIEVTALGRQEATLRIDRVALTRGDQALPGPASPPRARGDGSIEVDRGAAVELSRGTGRGVEQSWRFERPPPGTGDLAVRLSVSGAAFQSESGDGLRFAGLRYGLGTWIDARGRRSPLRPGYQRGEIVLRVPAEVVESSAYPAVLDPLISPELEVDRPVSGPARAGRYAASVAFNGAVYLVAWVDYRYGGFGDIYGARFATDGTLLDPAGIPIAARADFQFIPSVATDGTNFLVTWTDFSNGASSDIYGARVSSAGALLDPAPIPISTAPDNQQDSTVAFDGPRYLVVWGDFRGTTIDIYGARVTPTGTVLEPAGIPICTAAGTQQVPQVAFTNGTFLVVWDDARAGRDIYGARVSSAGVVQEANGFVISAAASNQLFPAVAQDGIQFLVAWADQRTGSTDIYGARVSSLGAVQDPAGIPIVTATGTQLWPTVTFGGNFLVAWEDYRSASATRIYGAWVAPDAGVMDPGGFPISGTEGESFFPHAASDGARFIVTWDHFSGRSLEGDGQLARVSAAGGVLDVPPLTLAPPAVTASRHSEPAVARGSGGYLLVWRDPRNGSLDIYATRILEDGTVLDPDGILISGAPLDQIAPMVASDGRDYLVVWQDFRNNLDFDIYGARVTGDGQVLDPGGLPIATGAGGQSSPSVSFEGPNYLVLWSNGNILGARIAPAGGVLPPGPFQISSSGLFHTRPRIASSGTESLAVWMVDQGRFWDLYGARIVPDGGVLDSPERQIAVTAADQVNPAITFNGVQYVVAWQDSRSGAAYELYAARVGQNGTVLDPGGKLLSTGSRNQRNPAIVHDGARTWIAWQSIQLDGGVDILATRLDEAGATVPPGQMTLSGEAYDEGAPALAAGTRGRVLLAYNRYDPTPSRETSRTRARLLADVPLGAACQASAECAEGVPCTRGRCCDDRCVQLTSTPAPQAECGGPFRYSPAGSPTASGEGPYVYAVTAASGAPLPAGLSVISSTGEIRWTPSREQVGPQRFLLLVAGAFGTDSQEISVEVTCAPLHANVGCNCGAASAPVTSVLALGVLAVLRRAARRSGPPRRAP